MSVVMVLAVASLASSILALATESHELTVVGLVLALAACFLAFGGQLA